MPALRAIFRGHLGRREALKAAKQGDTYTCALCLRLTEAPQVDHKTVVIPVTGFDDWNGVMERMFCDVSGLRVLCKQCHKGVTSEQLKERKKHRG